MADHEVAKLSNPKGDLGGKKSSIIFLRNHKVIKHEQSQRGTWVAKHVFCKGCFLKTAIFHIFQRILKSLFHTKSNHNQSWSKKAKMAMEIVFKTQIHKYKHKYTSTQKGTNLFQVVRLFRAKTRQVQAQSDLVVTRQVRLSFLN